MNEKIDTIIWELEVWDELYFEWDNQLIKEADQYGCTLENSKWELWLWAWSDISEELELRDMEEQMQNLVDNAIKNE
jgi:hypothetical protein